MDSDASTIVGVQTGTPAGMNELHTATNSDQAV